MPDLFCYPKRSTRFARDGFNLRPSLERLEERLVPAVNIGDIFVSDDGNASVEQISSNGDTTTLSEFGYIIAPNLMEFDQLGNVILADSGIDNLIRIAPDGTQTLVAPGPSLDEPVGVAVLANGNYLYTTSANIIDDLRMITPDGAVNITIATGFDDAIDVVVGPDGDYYVSDFGNDRIVRVDSETFGSTVFATGGLIDGPTGLAFDASGNLIVASQENDRLIRVAPDGTQTLISQNGALDFNSLAGVAIQANGTILVANPNLQLIAKINPTTGAQSVISAGGFFTPIGLAIVTSPAAVTQDENGVLSVTFTPLDDVGLFTQVGSDSIQVTVNNVNIGTFTDVTQINVSALAGNDRIALLNKVTIPMAIDGGAGTDFLDLSALSDDILITLGTNPGTPSTFTSIEQITTGSGDDTFLFLSDAELAGILNGGAGIDILDLSRLNGPVSATLPSGTVMGGIQVTGMNYAIGPLFQNNNIRPQSANLTNSIGRRIPGRS